MAEMELSDDREHLYVKSGNIISTMTTAEVEKTLDSMGLMRTAMLPPIAAEWKCGQPVDCWRDPEFEVEWSALEGQPILHIRHNRFGWLHFVFEKPRAGKLAEALGAIAKATEPTVAGNA